MTAEMKDIILELKENNYSYREISLKLSVPLGTVKAICSRGKIKQKDSFCLFCGKLLKVTPGKRTKKFCNDECRMAYWKENRSKLHMTAFYSFKCGYCGKTFQTYGRKNAKYCSCSCYLAARYHYE